MRVCRWPARTGMRILPVGERRAQLLAARAAAAAAAAMAIGSRRSALVVVSRCGSACVVEPRCPRGQRACWVGGRRARAVGRPQPA